MYTPLMNYLSKVKALPWEDFLSLDAEFPVAGKSIKSKLFSVPDCQAITKKRSLIDYGKFIIALQVFL